MAGITLVYAPATVAVRFTVIVHDPFAAISPPVKEMLFVEGSYTTEPLVQLVARSGVALGINPVGRLSVRLTPENACDEE